MKLIEPSEELEASYRDYIVELGDTLRVPFSLNYSADPFFALIERLVNQSRGIGIREGFVPNSSFWLVHDGQLLGVSNLRHSLTPSLASTGGHIGFGVRPSVQRTGVGTQLLRLTLERAAMRGLSRVLLTCDADNFGSAGVIKANSGRLENEVIDSATGKCVQRYWIDVGSSATNS